MANSVVTNPIIIDTADATVEIIAHNVMISSIRWVSDATANDAAEIKDQAGNVKWESLATSSNYTEAEKDFDPHLWVQGALLCPTLDSGKLYITIV